MDFGDILNQWDSEQKKSTKNSKGSQKGIQKSHKKANAPTKEEKEAMRQGYSWEAQMEADNKRHINPMELWLNRYGTVDKDKISDEAKQDELMHNREYLKNLRPEAVLDLHGLTREEAWSKMNSFVTDCARRGFKKIMIIHGKGNHSHGSDPVLGQEVRLFIEQDKRLGSSGHPDRNNGGTGATWVLLK